MQLGELQRRKESGNYPGTCDAEAQPGPYPTSEMSHVPLAYKSNAQQGVQNCSAGTVRNELEGGTLLIKKGSERTKRGANVSENVKTQEDRKRLMWCEGAWKAQGQGQKMALNEELNIWIK